MALPAWAPRPQQVPLPLRQPGTTPAAGSSLSPACTISPAKPPTPASAGAAPASAPGAPCAPGQPAWLQPAVPTPARPAAAPCLGGEPARSPTGAVPAPQPLPPVSSHASRPPAAGSPGARLLHACARVSCALAPQQSARLPGLSGPVCPAHAGRPCGAALCEAVRAGAASAATQAGRRGTAHGGAGLLLPPPHAAGGSQAACRQETLDSHHSYLLSHQVDTGAKEWPSQTLAWLEPLNMSWSFAVVI